MKKKERYQKVWGTSGRISSNVISFSINPEILHYAKQNGFTATRLLNIFVKESLGIDSLGDDIKKEYQRKVKEKGIKEGEWSKKITEIAVREILNNEKDKEIVNIVKNFKKTGDI